MSFKKICICLILIFCIIGAASAAEDVSTDVVDASADAVVVDAVSEDVSDSLELVVVEDEPVVVDSASAQDEIDDVELEASVDEEPALDEVDDEFSGQSHDILRGDDVVTVDDPDFLAYYYNFMVNDNGIIYLGDATYNNIELQNIAKNISFIGLSKNAIFSSVNTRVRSNRVTTSMLTFINLTFINAADFTMNSNFINCTFVNSNIDIAKGIADIEHLDETPYGVTYNLTFDNCEFKDVNTLNSIFTVYKYGKVVLNNCTFDNIVADSIIGRNGDFIDQDGIYLYDCSFTNCNIKGVVDIPGNIEIADYCAIENCDYDFDATTDIAMVDEYSHNYLNATKLKVVAVDSAVDISSSEKGVVVITLTDGANPIAGATVKYTVNGGDEQTDVPLQ